MMLRINRKTIWTISLVLYIICSSAFSYGSLKMLNTYALYLFLGVSAVNILMNQKIKLNSAVVGILLYAVLLLIGMLYTPTVYSAAKGVLYNYVTMAVIVFCVVQYIQSVEDVKKIMFAYMLAGFALAIYVYSQYGNAFWTLMQEATDNKYGQVDRLGSSLTNVNLIGMYTMISAVIAAYNIIFDRTGKIKTLLCIAIGVFCFVVSMAAASKKSVVILITAVICIWMYSTLGTRNLGKQIRNLLIVCGCVVLFFWMIKTLPIFSGISVRMDSFLKSLDGGSGTVSEANRSAYTSKGFSVWLNNILLGDGTAASIHYFGVYTHNNYIEVLMNTGIVGFILFYGIYPSTIYKYLRNSVGYRKQNRLTILLFALLMCVTVSGVALVYYYERYYMILVAVVVSATGYLGKGKLPAAGLSNEGEKV